MFLDIAGRRIGPGQPLFVIAELGLNHGGSLEQALALVDAAAAAGASAVKLQTFRADELVAAGCPAPAHVPQASLRDFFRQFELDKEAHRAVAERAKTRGLAFMATPFSCASVDLLEEVGVDALKIASGDLTYKRLIQRCAQTGLPLVISTGMSTLAETSHAIGWARAAGGRSISLLHCVSSYPVPDGSQNLRAIETLGRAFGQPVGHSDHARNTAANTINVAL
jgi:N,N'-diacetyllegionaminate synthase